MWHNRKGIGWDFALYGFVSWWPRLTSSCFKNISHLVTVSLYPGFNESAFNSIYHLTCQVFSWDRDLICFPQTFFLLQLVPVAKVSVSYETNLILMEIIAKVRIHRVIYSLDNFNIGWGHFAVGHENWDQQERQLLDWLIRILGKTFTIWKLVAVTGRMMISRKSKVSE